MKKLLIALGLAFLSLLPAEAVLLSSLSQGANPVAVQSNATVTTSGSSVVSTANFGSQQLSLLINVLNAPTGTTPTIVYSVQELDSGDGATAIGSFSESQVINAVGTYLLPLYVTNSNKVKVIWTVTGSSPSFTGVYTTLVTKSTTGISTPMGEMRVSTPPGQAFIDQWDSGTLDATDRWTVTSSGGGVAPVDAGFQMQMGSGTTGGGYSTLASQVNFTPASPAWYQIFWNNSIENPVLTNAYRFWGVGTNPGTPTAALPLTDAVGWEVDISGKLNAVTFASGTRNLIQDLSSATGNSKQPTDSKGHSYIIFYRGDRIFWAIDTEANVVANIPTGALGPDNNLLPLKALVVANTTPPGSSVTIACNAVYVGDPGHNFNAISDGTFGFRKAVVKKSSTPAAATDNALVTTLSPTELTFTGQSAQTATVNNIITVTSGTAASDVSGYASASVQINSTGTAGTYIFEGSNDNTNFITIPVYNQTLVTGLPITAAVTASSANILYSFPINYQFLRVRIVSTITGGSIQAFSNFKKANWSPAVASVASPTTANTLTNNNTVSLNGTAQVTGGVAGVPSVGGNVAVAAARTANPVPTGGVDTSGLTRVNLMDVVGGQQHYGPGESVTTFSVGTGAASVTDGTNGKTIFLQPKNADFYVGFSAVSTTPTIQFEISYDNVLFAIIPLSRVDTTATAQQYNGAGAFTPVLASMWRGKTYGAPIIRVHLTAGTTTNTVGQLRVVYQPEPAGTTISPFAFTATNTTEAVGVANGQIFTGGVRTMIVPVRGSCIAQLEIDADTGTNTVALEGSQDLGTTWNALSMQPLGGGATVTSFASTGTASLPQTGTWQADVSGMTNVRAHCTAYTGGNPFGAVKLIAVPSAVMNNNRKPTYTASVSGAVTATTNVLSIASGSAKTTIIKRIVVNGGTATAITDGSLTLIRGTVAAPAGGTSVTAAIMQHNPADAAFSGAVLQGIASAITTTGLTSTSSAVVIPTPVETATLGVSNNIIYDFTCGGSIEGFQIPVAATNSVLFSFTGTTGGGNFALSVDFTEE